jgi:sulfatase maturation enzyme AslB (radical SAM superfamily)
MANYEVEFTAVFTVVVKNAESKEQAEEFAQDEFSEISFSHVVETKTRLIESASDLESSVRHADAVSDD